MMLLLSKRVLRWGGRWVIAAACFASIARAANDDPVAVLSTVSNGYTRTRLPDHSFKPEYYAFGEGGSRVPAGSDPSLQQIKFLRVASAVAGPLARMNYLPAPKGTDPQLMILLFWGATQGSQDHDLSGAADQLASASAVLGPKASSAPGSWAVSQRNANANSNNLNLQESDTAQEAFTNALWQMNVANETRDQIDNRNARLLGYTEAMQRAMVVAHMGAGADVISEISRNRYFVVLQAYDFAVADKQKKLKLLWSARISVDAAGNPYTGVLGHMLDSAAPLFGQDSHGLRRDVVRSGRVEVGTPEVIEDSPKK